MKLILITAVKEFEKDIIRILKNSDITIFSYNEIIGYRNIPREANIDNWFPGERKENKSVMFYAFVKKEETDELFERIKVFNEKQESLSKIHISILNIEKSN
ncbi:hypothetical protein MNBD_BACTEROID04-812 [hydrothermal vent metagenome]|uniref:Nitrogen regulatory protein P-II n=1 Tax=hydrothermal vent metagenome TaxID=652676 RepID=A0A3B0V0Y3_9ZZZZ